MQGQSAPNSIGVYGLATTSTVWTSLTVWGWIWPSNVAILSISLTTTHISVRWSQHHCATAHSPQYFWTYNSTVTPHTTRRLLSTRYLKYLCNNSNPPTMAKKKTSFGRRTKNANIKHKTRRAAAQATGRFTLLDDFCVCGCFLSRHKQLYCHCHDKTNVRLHCQSSSQNNTVKDAKLHMGCLEHTTFVFEGFIAMTNHTS